ncbi:MAG TPA: 2-oxoacid:acceptor oxidoreductase subunit alpha [Patescibacteria group bacterium]
MDQNIYSIKIGGEAGQGIKLTGQLLSKILIRSGLSVFTYSEYPSLIRGGHNVMQLIFSSTPVSAPIKSVHFLIALDSKTIELHSSELADGAVIIYDSDRKINTESLGKYKLLPVPFNRFAKAAGGTDVVANTVASAALLAVLGFELTPYLDLINESFAAKSQELVTTNQSAARSGYDFVKANYPQFIQATVIPASVSVPRILINGNEAIALAAIAAGLQFASIYPMTPITGILENLAKYQKQFGYIYKQPEDEISAINMAIGASYAGARALTATSGGGFCLMTEGYGLAGMTETPLVIIEGMRGGPATGLPTWNEQSDLRFVLHAHQGEFPRIVLAASDAADAFTLTLDAFNLSQRYQTPVLVLVDKNICECDQSIMPFSTDNYKIDNGLLQSKIDPVYQRYLPTTDGISPRAFPGSGNFFVTNSDEHDSFGFSDESQSNRNLQEAKRLNKLAVCALKDMAPPKLYGPENASLTIVSWGSTKGSVLQALSQLKDVNYLHFTWMNPFPATAAAAVLSKSKIILDVENNSTAQLAGLIREHTGIEIKEKLLKNDGRPTYPEEIISKVTNLQQQLCPQSTI